MASRVAVLGYGVTGASVVRHLQRQGAEPVVLDTRAPQDVTVPNLEVMWEMDRWPKIAVDYAVVSPGLSLDSCLVAGAAASGIELVSDIDLFFEAAKKPVIGITGTNGKSTVTSLVGHVLQDAGMSCGVGGNLGIAALDVLDEQHEYYVLELSSFQLERSRKHQYLASTILNISEDHLDKHADMASYIAAKQRIYASCNHAVFNRQDDNTQPAGVSGAVSFGLDKPPSTRDWGLCERDDDTYLVKGEQVLMARSEVPLPGLHNLQNTLAAAALVAPIIDLARTCQAVKSFRGLPHRFERVAKWQGVEYINDSKATNIGATIAALGGVAADNQVILIAGGDAKGVDLTPLGPLLDGRVRHVVVLGVDGDLIAAVANDRGVPSSAVDSMQAAVERAAALAKPGNVVLLSPACASLDMFTNYMERGRQFAQAVLAMTGKADVGTGVGAQ